MRDIKFRGKILGYNTGEHCLDFAYGDLVNELSTGKKFILDLCKFDEDTKIKDCLLEVEDDKVMQYTGLKDINGKEIYEGDILYHEHFKEKYKIIYDNECSCFIAEDFYKSYQDVPWDFFGEDYYKNFYVIGNIYENPELLD